MGESTWRALSDSINDGDLDGVLGLVEPLSEVERKQLSKPVAAAVRDHRDAIMVHSFCPVCYALALAEFAVCPASKVRRRLIRFDERYARLLRARDRAWRQTIIDRVTGRVVSWAFWQTTHELVREGLVARPTGSWYVASGALAIEIWEGDPDWLEHDFWRIFEVEEAADVVSAQTRGAAVWRVETYPQAIFGDLAARGIVSRSRMLAAALGGLRRDFPPRSTLFFRRLIPALEPTVDELSALLDELLALLANDDVADVAFALDQLLTLAEAHRLPPQALFEALEPALAVRVKKHALTAVRLAASVLNADPGAGPLAMPVLIEALVHEKADVQKAAFALIQRHESALRPADRDRLSEMLADLDPALRGAAAVIAGDLARGDVAAVDAVTVPTRQAIDPTAPRLEGVEALAPIESADELLDRIAAELEWPWRMEEWELLLDAVLRVPVEAFDLRRVREVVPWLNRPAVSGPYTGPMYLGVPIHWVLSSLCARLGLPPDKNVANVLGTGAPIDAVIVRAAEILNQPRAYPGLLSAPTHAGGWIDPIVAVRRVAALRAPALPVDLAQLVLRMAPDGREDALAAAGELATPEGAVVAHALGADTEPSSQPGHLASAWLAASDARNPAAHRLSGYPPTEVVSVIVRITSERRERWQAELDRLHALNRRARGWGPDVYAQPFPNGNPASLLELDDIWFAHGQPTPLRHWMPTVWPANREALYRIVTRRLWYQAPEDDSESGELLSLLLTDRREPVGSEAVLAIGMALGTDDIKLRGLAIEVIIEAIANRRLDGVTLGQALARILREHRPLDEPVLGYLNNAAAVPERWTEPLTDVARSSPLGAHDVQNAIESVFSDARPEDRRRLSGLLQLLRSLALDADAAVTNQRAREYLAAYSSGTAGGKAAREILGVSGNGGARSRAAVNEIDLGAR